MTGLMTILGIVSSAAMLGLMQPASHQGPGHRIQVNVAAGAGSGCAFVATLTVPMSRDEFKATPAFRRLPHVLRVEGQSMQDVVKRMAGRQCR